MSTGPMTLSFRLVNCAYAILWFLMYLVCYYYNYISSIDPSANFPKICSIGIHSILCWSFSRIILEMNFLGLVIHYTLGICLCAVTYFLFIVKTASLNEFKAQFHDLDAKLYDISGFKTNFVVISNRFQVSLVICGFVLFIGTTVVDTLILVS